MKSSQKQYNYGRHMSIALWAVIVIGSCIYPEDRGGREPKYLAVSVPIE